MLFLYMNTGIFYVTHGNENVNFVVITTKCIWILTLYQVIF